MKVIVTETYRLATESRTNICSKNLLVMRCNQLAAFSLHNSCKEVKNCQATMQVIEELIETCRGVQRMSAVGPFNNETLKI
jgi:hypothetical protein